MIKRRRFDWAKDADTLRAALAQAMTRAGFSCETLIVEPGELQEGYCDRWGVVISTGGDQAFALRAAVWTSRWLEKHGFETCSAGCFQTTDRLDVTTIGDTRAIVVLRSFVIGD